MDVKVVVGDAKPCSDLASRLAMVYELLLRRAAEVEAGHRIEKQAPAGESLVATPVEASDAAMKNTRPLQPDLVDFVRESPAANTSDPPETTQEVEYSSLLQAMSRTLTTE